MDPLPADASPPVRLLTYNTHHGVGIDGRLDLERIARVIESLTPDVVFLQELDRGLGARSRFVDQPAWYAQRLGMDVFFAPTLGGDHPRALREARGEREPGEYGHAILARVPLRNTAATPLPRHPRDEPRVLAQADVRLGGRVLRVHGTHLTQNSIAGRNAQVAMLREVLATCPLPAVVAGDFNTYPRSRAATAMRRGMDDAWFTADERAGAPWDGVPVLGALAGFTMGNPVPTRRIDHVYVPSGARVRAARVVLDARTRVASDHLPVLVEVEPAW